MKISKLEEGLIGMTVGNSRGSGGREYNVVGNYTSGKAVGRKAFDYSVFESYDEHDPSFSPKESAADCFAFEIRSSPYSSLYVDGKIEVRRKNGNN